MAGTAIGQDTAPCAACLAELCDPADRRWRHAFITCTHCGPRYTLAAGVPYDRVRTSLAGFAFCPACAAEYAAPDDRRFHAETSCCPACGPQLALVDAQGRSIDGDPVAQTLARLHAGQIVAIKGLGGFHLACDARNGEAVARLRRKKQREEKPFALLAANAKSMAGLVTLEPAAEALLNAAERPIVLLKKRPGADAALPGLAPGMAWLGLMLPATPMHWLLFHEAAGRPPGTGWMDQAQDLLLVMTSANPGGEPLVIANDEAQQRLAGIADAYLLHDRDILVRCDDSVMRTDGPRRATFIRRARGYTPLPIRLARGGPSVLALGGGLKNAICVTRGDQAFVSQHLGDMDNGPACAFLEETVDHLLAVLEVRPQAVACDLHPDFHATRLARDLAERLNIPLIPVQHHHAHIAALAAEHGHLGPLLGLALDGVGLGDDGGAWGGEILQLEGPIFRRLAHLRPLVLPGGDRAAREPWRMAAAALHALGRGEQIGQRFAAQPAAAQLASVIERGINCPPTPSLGRVFDSAAGLLGIKAVASYEGQAAMLLESQAAAWGAAAPWADGWRLGEDGNLDLLPLLAHIAEWTGTAGEGAARFHATLSAALAAWVSAAVAASGLRTLALGGGCFLNQILSRELVVRLNQTWGDSLTLLTARQLPPNDGGISLGQAWVALNTMEKNLCV